MTYGLSTDYALLSFVFLSTIIGYNFVKYFPQSKVARRMMPQASKAIQVFSMAISLLFVVNCFYVSKSTIALSLCLGLINVFYAVPLPHKTLREIPFLKVIIIAFIWTVVSLFYPFLDKNINPEYDFQFCFEILERFIWVVLLMIPFEIRDYKFDKDSLKTMATALGIAQLKIAGMIVISILLVSRIWIDKLDFNAFHLIVYVSFILSIIGSKENQNAYYASFWVEALPMIWLFGLAITTP